MNLEELVRAALAAEAKAEPGEAGAYERFLGRRRRGALAVAASTGLAVALVLALAVGGALALRTERGDQGQVARPGGAVADLRRDAGPYPSAGTGPDDPARPAAGARLPHRGGPPGAPGVRADPTQGLEGRSVDDQELRPVRPAMAGHLARAGGHITANDQRRMTILTAVTRASRIPRQRATGHPLSRARWPNRAWST